MAVVVVVGEKGLVVTVMVIQWKSTVIISSVDVAARLAEKLL